MKKELSVIIPAYNEEKAIAATLTEVCEYLANAHYTFEVLVLNDGSTDTTVEKVREVARKHPQLKLIDRQQNMGKGETVKEGIQYAKYPYVLFMDADNSTSITEWPKFEEAFDRDYPVVIASRHMKGSNITHPQPLFRRVLGTGYRVIARILFGVKCSDFNCGFKAYETSIAKKIYQHVTMRDWTFDLEVFILLKQHRTRWAEVPVTWHHEDKASHLKPVQTAIKSLSSLGTLKSKY